jgi:DNA modification methylase
MPTITWTNCQCKLSDLREWENNPAEIGKDAAARLVESLVEFGQIQPIAIDPDNVIIDGHQRKSVWSMASAFGPDYLADCRRASRTLTERERQKLAVFLRSGAVGRYSWDALANWDAADLQAWGMDKTTLREWQSDAGALKAFIEANEPETKDAEPQIDRAAELLEKWGVVTGDLWQIGEHRLLCGDSTKREDVERVMGGEKAILMVTDPPYGVEYDADWRNRADRANGKPYGASAIGVVTNDERVDWTEAYLLFTGDVAYIWHCGRSAREVSKNIEDAGFNIISQLIWVKSNIVISRGDYHYKHEPCWYAVRKGKNHNWQGSRKETSVWEIDKPMKSETGHSTQKPIECMSKPIENNTKDGDLVYEPFAGSGTTLVACENLNRKCRAIEISPAYCAVILERFSVAFPGIKIERIE